MISEQKFRDETPYGVKNFQNFHFQKHAPIMEKRLAKKKFQKDQLQCEVTREHPHVKVALKKYKNLDTPMKWSLKDGENISYDNPCWRSWEIEGDETQKNTI